jgi:hypothetical protein
MPICSWFEFYQPHDDHKTVAKSTYVFSILKTHQVNIFTGKHMITYLLVCKSLRRFDTCVTFVASLKNPLNSVTDKLSNEK